MRGKERQMVTQSQYKKISKNTNTNKNENKAKKNTSAESTRTKISKI